ncbi:MAG TPA: hypothetical protein VJ208_04185, partial [Candidatus Nanoarchaeia archaeon]|nr:hypothetical protein [Candidatus Nanoarchaeia archaeon]
MSDFLFHKVSESEKESIKKEAKKIMDDFSKRLSSIKEKIPEPSVEREEFEREEKILDVNISPPARPQGKIELSTKSATSEDEDFRKRF